MKAFNRCYASQKEVIFVKQLTDTEKQELQEKSPNPTEDSKWASAVTRFTSSYLWKYGFLALILCFVIFNAFILIRWWRLDDENNHIEHQSYMGLVIALILLFNHIAYYFTTKGWKSWLMKTVAWVWIGLGFVYFFWVLG